MAGDILTLNAGSSRLKFSFWHCETSMELSELFRGEVEKIGTAPHSDRRGKNDCRAHPQAYWSGGAAELSGFAREKPTGLVEGLVSGIKNQRINTATRPTDAML